MKLKTAYLANVGTRDLQIDGKKIPDARHGGKAVGLHYDTKRGELTAPILMPGLRYVIGKSGRIDLLVLFVTDQPEPPENSPLRQHWNDDTIEFGNVLKRFIKDELGAQIGEIQCRAITTNPADHDLAFTYFSRELASFVPPDEYQAVWAVPTGGVPATNLALTSNSIRLYEDHCQLLYVSPSGTVQKLHLHEEVLKNRDRDILNAHLHRWDFEAARQTLERTELGYRYQTSLCRYADCRLRFDFEGGSKALSDAMREAKGAEARAEVQKCIDSLQPLLAASTATAPDSSAGGRLWTEWLSVQRVSLKELHFNLRIKSARGEWVDFLGRLFRLHEAALRLLFEQATRHSADAAGGKFPDFIKAISADAKAVEYFTKKGISFETVTRGSLRTWLDFKVQCDGAKYGPIKRAFDSIEQLASLRNKSILAHGYQGIGRESIESALKGNKSSKSAGSSAIENLLDQDLTNLFVVLDVPPLKDPFEMILPSLNEV